MGPYSIKFTLPRVYATTDLADKSFPDLRDFFILNDYEVSLAPTAFLEPKAQLTLPIDDFLLDQALFEHAQANSDNVALKPESLHLPPSPPPPPAAPIPTAAASRSGPDLPSPSSPPLETKDRDQQRQEGEADRGSSSVPDSQAGSDPGAGPKEMDEDEPVQTQSRSRRASQAARKAASQDQHMADAQARHRHKEDDEDDDEEDTIQALSTPPATVTTKRSRNGSVKPQVKVEQSRKSVKGKDPVKSKPSPEIHQLSSSDDSGNHTDDPSKPPKRPRHSTKKSASPAIVTRTNPKRASTARVDAHASVPSSSRSMQAQVLIPVANAKSIRSSPQVDKELVVPSATMPTGILPPQPPASSGTHARR